MTRSNQSPRTPKVVKKAAKKIAKEKGVTPDKMPASLRSAIYPVTRRAAGGRIMSLGFNHWEEPVAPPCWHCHHSDDSDEKPKVQKSATTRRNPGRMDGRKWNGSSFICPLKVDDEESETKVDIAYIHAGEDEANGVFDDIVPAVETKPHVIELLGIARPAKPKGVAKEFEVIQPLDRVIALEDNETPGGYWESDWESGSDDDSEGWDDLYEDAFPKLPRTALYSAVLKDKGKEKLKGK